MHCNTSSISIALSIRYAVTLSTHMKRSAWCSPVPQAYDEYAKRLRPVLTLETQWHKTDEELEAAVRKDSGVVVRMTRFTC